MIAILVHSVGKLFSLWNTSEMPKTDMRVRDIRSNFAFVEISYAYSQISIPNIARYSYTHLS